MVPGYLKLHTLSSRHITPFDPWCSMRSAGTEAKDCHHEKTTWWRNHCIFMRSDAVINLTIEPISRSFLTCCEKIKICQDPTGLCYQTTELLLIRYSYNPSLVFIAGHVTGYYGYENMINKLMIIYFVYTMACAVGIVPILSIYTDVFMMFASIVNISLHKLK